MLAEWMADSMRSDLWTDLIDRILVPIRAERPFAGRFYRRSVFRESWRIAKQSN